MTNPELARLLKYTKRNDATGCLEWTGWKDRDGYGQIRVRGVGVRRAHRRSYELQVGPIPPGILVCHKCDNPSCIEKDHLWLGTDWDNHQDKMWKGRAIALRGEDQPNCRITENQVHEITELCLLGDLSMEAIGRRFGITGKQVRHIRDRARWKHVPWKFTWQVGQGGGT